MHNVLNANHKHRIAVIVNDFGDTSGIESAMVKTAQVLLAVLQPHFDHRAVLLSTVQLGTMTWRPH